MTRAPQTDPPAIRRCTEVDFDVIWGIINDGAAAYRGIIPADRWSEPYMSRDELAHEIRDGVEFSGFDDGGTVLGIMGIQFVQDVTLIRHAYVRTGFQGRGIGTALLTHLRDRARGSVLIGSWSAATWAIRFYQRHGFTPIPPEDKTRLLRQYWTIPDRQVETSVVLAIAGSVVTGKDRFA